MFAFPPLARPPRTRSRKPQFERDLLIERTQSGLKRAKAEGAVFGRPATLDADQREAVRAGLADGASVSELAKLLGTSRQTIMRVRDAAAGSSPVRRAAARSCCYPDDAAKERPFAARHSFLQR
jgi:Helix-turn-helix domain